MAAPATVTRYARLLARLLPQGLLTQRVVRSIDEDSTVGSNLLHGLAEELGRLEDRGVDVREEADPRTTLELLSDWERLVGLPDPCAGQLPTVEGRRDAVVARLVSLPSAAPSSFVAKAAELGFAVTVEELSCWCAGIGAAGDELYDGDWAFVWILHAASDLSADERAQLECAIGRLVPAQTKVEFEYDLLVLRVSPVVVTVSLPSPTVS